MKIVVVTDSHGRTYGFKDIVGLEKPEIVIWTGDYCEDAQVESYRFPNIEFYIVKGNCDIYEKNFRDEEIIEVEDKKILLTHGHLYKVKKSMLALEGEAEKNSVDIVCFGHTHQPYLELKNSIYYFNPGALKDGRYGIIEIKDKKIEFEQKSI